MKLFTITFGRIDNDSHYVAEYRKIRGFYGELCGLCEKLKTQGEILWYEIA